MLAGFTLMTAALAILPALGDVDGVGKHTAVNPRTPISILVMLIGGHRDP